MSDTEIVDFLQNRAVSLVWTDPQTGEPLYASLFAGTPIPITGVHGGCDLRELVEQLRVKLQ